MAGTKHDAEKVRLELISPYALEGLGKILTFGAKKYSAWNWAAGINYSRVIGATQRHINAILRLEDFDVETGLLHADHAMCELMFLSHYQHNSVSYSKFDDRFKLPELPF